MLVVEATWWALARQVKMAIECHNPLKRAYTLNFEVVEDDEVALVMWQVTVQVTQNPCQGYGYIEGWRNPTYTPTQAYPTCNPRRFQNPWQSLTMLHLGLWLPLHIQTFWSSAPSAQMLTLRSGVTSWESTFRRSTRTHRFKSMIIFGNFRTLRYLKWRGSGQSSWLPCQHAPERQNLPDWSFQKTTMLKFQGTSIISFRFAFGKTLSGVSSPFTVAMTLKRLMTLIQPTRVILSPVNPSASVRTWTWKDHTHNELKRVIVG